MNLLIPGEIAERIWSELRRAGRVETGGVLMGEHVSEGTFRVADMTVQQHGGTLLGFLRWPEAHAAQLASFYERKAGCYTKFNYLGEWHSHPNAPACPSIRDIEEMTQIAQDPEVGVNFAVLLIVRLARFRRLKGTATVFVRSRDPATAKLVWEHRRRIPHGHRVPSLAR